MCVRACVCACMCVCGCVKKILNNYAIVLIVQIKILSVAIHVRLLKLYKIYDS